MNIYLEWPDTRQEMALSKTLTFANALAFDVCCGAFSLDNQSENSNAVFFYWHMNRLMMLNLCAEHVCRLDGAQIKYGSVQPLKSSSKIQAGHFKLAMSSGNDHGMDEQTFYHFIWSGIAPGSASKPPDIQDILPNAGQGEMNSVDFHDDALKMLEVEYKRFLVWQDQGGNIYDGLKHQNNYLSESDKEFEYSSEQLKEKTLTECIVGKKFLMDEVWADLEMMADDEDNFCEEEKRDLLRALAPENISSRKIRKVSELTTREYNKVGLDSYY